MTTHAEALAALKELHDAMYVAQSRAVDLRVAITLLDMPEQANVAAQERIKYLEGVLRQIVNNDVGEGWAGKMARAALNKV